MHIVDDPKCACGSVREDAKHFFFTCPLYIMPRNKLQGNISNIADLNLNLEIILNGSKNVTYDENIAIFQCVHDYIDETQRFQC